MWGSFSTMISTLITIICLCGGLCKITRQVSSAFLWHNTSSHLINGSTDSISQNMIQNITILLTTFPCSLTTTHLTVAIWVGLNTEKTYVALVTIISYLLTNMLYRPRSSLYKLNRNGSSTYPRYTEFMFLLQWFCYGGPFVHIELLSMKVETSYTNVLHIKSLPCMAGFNVTYLQRVLS